MKELLNLILLFVAACMIAVKISLIKEHQKNRPEEPRSNKSNEESNDDLEGYDD